MKIGFVFDDTLDKTDGIQQYMASLAGWLTANGHEVHYLVGETKRTDIANVHSLSRNMRVSFNGNQLSIPIYGSRKCIKALLNAEKFDVLHVSAPYHPYMAGRIMKLAPSPTRIVATFHILPYGRLATLGAKLQWVLSRSSQKRLQAMVSVSPAAQSFSKRVYKLDSKVVPNAFDYERFASAKSLPQYDDEVITILSLGRLVPRKGCMILMQALAHLKQSGKQYPAFRALVCGGGPMEAELKQFAKDQKLTDIVSFMGRVSEEDKPRYYASADISVFPSTAGESFGIVLVEAMACGRAAVIGGDNPGYRSVLGEAPGALFAANDVEALACKLDELLLQTAKRRELAIWAQQSVKQYDVNVVGPKILDLYHPDGQNSSKG